MLFIKFQAPKRNESWSFEGTPECLLAHGKIIAQPNLNQSFSYSNKRPGGSWNHQELQKFEEIEFVRVPQVSKLWEIFIFNSIIYDFFSD